MNRGPTDVYVVVDGLERDVAGPMTASQAGTFLTCLDRYRSDLAGHAVYGTALPEDAKPAGLEEFHIHPAVLDREG